MKRRGYELLEIEIGSEEEKDQIIGELKLLKGIIDKKWKERSFRLIISGDFDKTIKELTGDEEYNSIRNNIGHRALAKTLDIDNTTIFVYSHQMFNGLFDTQVRYVYYLHELQHSLIKLKEPAYDGQDPNGDEMLRLNNHFFNEYNANRYSLVLNKQIFQTESILFKEFRDSTIQGHLKTLLDTELNFDIVKESILKYRYHCISIDELLAIIWPIVGGVHLDISFFFSYYDEFDEYFDLLEEIKKCNFVNERTFALINYYRELFKTLDYTIEIDLADGEQLLHEQLKNFGMTCQNSGENIYINVHPI